MIISLGSFSLFSGLVSLLFVLDFPVLGPTVSSNLDLLNMIFLYVFAFVYSWMWVDASSRLLECMNRARGGA